MRRLVIDTDGVSDDVRAISLALQHPNAEVLAITTVAGCVTSHQAVANVARTLRANKVSNIPIYKGAESPLIGNGHAHMDEVGFFGSDGLGNAPTEFPPVLPTDMSAHVADRPAALALIELFREQRDVTLVCIGPLTNVALALKLEPQFAEWPVNVVIMGGNVYGAGNVRSGSTAEFNFSNDVEAAHIVLREMTCPITVVPWECFLFESEKTDVNFHAHLSLDIPLAHFFEMATRLGRVELERNKRQFAYCDEIAMSVAIAPEVIIKESKILRGAVELHGQYTRQVGQVAVDWTDHLWSEDEEHAKVNRQSRPMTFVTSYNVKNLDKLVFDTIYRSSGTATIEDRFNALYTEDKKQTV
ncbi:Protein Y43F8C.13 [Aphelenchoides avenae]|nr:Protein Y43F8C.13 [Aphelenchus avenae]